MSRFARILAVASILALPIAAANAQQVLYVDDDALPGGDCRSWDTACKYLQDALARALTEPTTAGVPVAAGVYRPDERKANPDGTAGREATFQFICGAALYPSHRRPAGGRDPDDRDTQAFQSNGSRLPSGNDGDDQ